MDFLSRVRRLPRLGLGVSTEFGAGDGEGALDVVALRAERPEHASFLEVGIETARGLDRHAASWIEHGWPTTYHFLDVNLDEPEDLDAAWLGDVRAYVARLRPAWLCGDAGLWHFGRRERGHMLLLPPVLCDEAARETAQGIRALREAVGLEVLPENPPGSAYVGDLHLLDYFARVAERADTGLLLDCAHLAIYQRTMGHAPLAGFDGFPFERVVEMHVAGGTVRDAAGWAFVDDTHGVDVLDDTWAIFEAAVERARNLRAVVFECERNPAAATAPAFGRLRATLDAAWAGASAESAP